MRVSVTIKVEESVVVRDVFVAFDMWTWDKASGLCETWYVTPTFPVSTLHWATTMANAPGSTVNYWVTARQPA